MCDGSSRKRNRSPMEHLEFKENDSSPNKKLKMSTVEPLDADEANSSNILPMNEPITLNIGGTKFQTTLSTLSTIPNTVLYKMFEGTFSLKASKDGSYFIDRDSTHFRYILNFLRDRKVNLSDNSIIDQVLQEAEFYQIGPLIDKLKATKWQLQLEQIDSKILKPRHIEQIFQHQIQNKDDKTFKHWRFVMRWDTANSYGNVLWKEMINQITEPMTSESEMNVILVMKVNGLIFGVTIDSHDEYFVFKNDISDFDSIEIVQCEWKNRGDANWEECDIILSFDDDTQCQVTIRQLKNKWVRIQQDNSNHDGLLTMYEVFQQW